jgi:hypothetical protein
MTIWFSASCKLHHLAELVRPAGLSLANDFRRQLRPAEELAFTPRNAAEHAGARLFHHLVDARRHVVEFPAQAFQHVLEDQQPEHHVRRDAAPTVALSMAKSVALVGCVQSRIEQGSGGENTCLRYPKSRR